MKRRAHAAAGRVMGGVRHLRLGAGLLLGVLLVGCAGPQRVESPAPSQAPPARPPAVAAKPRPAAPEVQRPAPAPAYQARGQASYYAQRHQGRRTASGERLDNRALTAAHRDLPFGSRVRVTNLGNQRSVVVRINDRGPHTRGRLIDLSQAAARQLDMLRAGVAQVLVEQLSD